MLTFKTAAVAAGLGSVLIAGHALAQQIVQAAPAAGRAGVAAAVSGEVQLAAIPGVREVGKDVVSGDPIFLGDKITTGPQGRLQIMLRDETVFTLGPKAALVIDKFVYDPSTNAGKVSATVLQGTFRFVSGKIAARQPSDMEVNLPVGSIGVRGTSVAGEVEGTRATVVLLGPGPENNAGERVGRILVTGSGQAGAATTIEIVRPGFATTISAANVPPTPPVRLDPVRLATLTSSLAGTAPKSDSGQGSQGQGAQRQGQAGGPAGTSVLRQSGPVAIGSLAGIRSIGVLVTQTQKATATSQAAATQHQQVKVPDGPTTFGQLHQIGVSSATISGSGSMSALHGTGSGSFTYTIKVDFGGQQEKTTVTGSYTNVGGLSGNINFIGTNSFAGKTGVIGNNGAQALFNAGGVNAVTGVCPPLTSLRRA